LSGTNQKKEQYTAPRKGVRVVASAFEISDNEEPHLLQPLENSKGEELTKDIAEIEND